MPKHAYPDSYFGQTAAGPAQGREDTLLNLSPYKRHLVAFIDALPPGARVLDVGCGSGRASKLALALRPDLVVEACDINDVSTLLPPSVAFKVCSVDEIASAYPENYFDAIICQHVIEHLLTPIGLAQSLQFVMKRGATIFLETPNWTRLYIPFSHMFFWNDYTHIKPYPKFAIAKLFLEHSMKVEKIITISSSQWFRRRSKKQSTTVKIEQKGAALVNAYAYNSLGARILAKILNPLMRDILIVIARKN